MKKIFLSTLSKAARGCFASRIISHFYVLVRKHNSGRLKYTMIGDININGRLKHGDYVFRVDLGVATSTVHLVVRIRE